MTWYECDLFLRSMKSNSDSCAEAVTTCECTCRLQGSQEMMGMADGEAALLTRFLRVEVRDHWPLKSILREKEANQLCGGSNGLSLLSLLSFGSFFGSFLAQKSTELGAGQSLECSFSQVFHGFPCCAWICLNEILNLLAFCLHCAWKATSLWVVH